MAQLLRRNALALWCALTLSASCVHADTPPQVAPGTALLVLDAGGVTSVNLRSRPDPRSVALDQISVGTSELRSTGEVAVYGDTYWVEVRSGTLTGWLNARFTAALPARTALQAYVNIDALQPIHGFDFDATPYSEATATSYEECARRCIGDVQCVAIGYSQAEDSQSCKQFAVWPDLSARSHSDVAAKAQPAPEGGWSANQTALFERIEEQGVASSATRTRVAHSGSQCAAQCSADASCAAYSFQRKLLLCRHYDSVSARVARDDTELGVRRRMASAEQPGQMPRRINSNPDLTVLMPPPLPPAADLEPQVSATLDDTSRPSRSVTSVVSAAVALARDLLADAVPADGWSAVDIAAGGRISARRSTDALVSRTSLSTASPGTAMPVQTEVAGDVNNLAPLLQPDEPGHVHLAFYSAPTMPPVILATKRFDTEVEAIAASLRMQQNLDEIAKLANLGIDRFALLKPMRR